MKSTRLVTVPFFLVVAVLAWGCKHTTKPEYRGQRGESCQARNDCEEGLACVRNVCILNEFDIAPLARHCEIIECQQDEDCCRHFEPHDDCDEYRADCWDGRDEHACDQFVHRCMCRKACENKRCIWITPCLFHEHCGDPEEGWVCREDLSRCEFICDDDDDCDRGESCINGRCIDACQTNGDCPYFNECQGGICVEVGCKTDRECIAFTDNPLARCVDASCTVPCVNDGECNPYEYQFQACVDGNCKYIGCQTDEECRIYLEIDPGAEVTAICAEGEG